MINREDAFEVIGGDTVQMERTRAALQALGVEVEVETRPGRINYAGFDLIHVFNWQELNTVLQAAGQTSIPIVLSPIFWFHTGHWFQEAAVKRPLWRAMLQILGRQNAQQVYETWQQVKFRRGPQGQALRHNLAIPRQILPNSRAEARYLESISGSRGGLLSRCTVVPNAVDRQLYDPAPQPDSDFARRFNPRDFVLEVARIQSAKNQLGLIEALFDVPAPIVFAGQPSPYEGEYVAACHALAEKRGRVYFTGPVPPEKLPGIYALAAVHVLPSWRETPGLASLEAAASGCRVVTTSIGSTREYFGEQAWYCDPHDTRSIRRAVLQALDTPPSGSLRQRVLEQYTWEAAARATLQAYEKALAGHDAAERTGLSPTVILP